MYQQHLSEGSPHPQHPPTPPTPVTRFPVPHRKRFQHQDHPWHDQGESVILTKHRKSVMETVKRVMETVIIMRSVMGSVMWLSMRSVMGSAMVVQILNGDSLKLTCSQLYRTSSVAKNATRAGGCKAMVENGWGAKKVFTNVLKPLCTISLLGDLHQPTRANLITKLRHCWTWDVLIYLQCRSLG